MSLVPSILASNIISAANREINRCGGRKNFDPSKFDRTFYLIEVYNYIKENTKISATYTGSIPGVGPDPLSGPKIFELHSVGAPGVLYSSFSEWWSTLITSIVVTSETNDSTGITIIPFTSFPITGELPVISDLSVYDSMEKIWNKLSEEIIDRVMKITFIPVNAISINGGIGTCVFNSLL